MQQVPLAQSTACFQFKSIITFKIMAQKNRNDKGKDFKLYLYNHALPPPRIKNIFCNTCKKNQFLRKKIDKNVFSLKFPVIRYVDELCEPNNKKVSFDASFLFEIQNGAQFSTPYRRYCCVTDFPPDFASCDDVLMYGMRLFCKYSLFLFKILICGFILSRAYN